MVGIEHIEPIADRSVEDLAKQYPKEVKEGTITIVCGDGRKGWKDLSPYDAIHVGAGKAL